MPRTACRVVCGFEDAMTIFWPTSALVSVDFPAFGLPTRHAKPERNCADSVTRYNRVNVSMPVLRNDTLSVQSRAGMSDADRLRMAPLGYRLDTTFVRDKLPMAHDAVDTALAAADAAAVAWFVEL